MRFFVLFLLLGLGLQAQPWEKPSASEGLVVWRSAAKALSAGDEEALEAVLGAINDSTSTQIVVLFVDSVKDDLNFVAAQTGEAWGYWPSRDRQRHARTHCARGPQNGYSSWPGLGAHHNRSG